MKPIQFQQIENTMTRQAIVFLALASIFGIGAGTFVTIYYDIVPNMDSIEDKLSIIHAILNIVVIMLSLIHLPRILWDAKNKAWKKAVVQALVFFGPLIVIMGGEGLISHWLWWKPINDTDRFHLLHHTVLVSAPLTFFYVLAARRWWVPINISLIPGEKSFYLTGIGTILIFTLGLSILFGGLSIAFLLVLTFLAFVGLNVYLENRKSAK